MPEKKIHGIKKLSNTKEKQQDQTLNRFSTNKPTDVKNEAKVEKVEKAKKSAPKNHKPKTSEPKKKTDDKLTQYTKLQIPQNMQKNQDVKNADTKNTETLNTPKNTTKTLNNNKKNNPQRRKNQRNTKSKKPSVKVYFLGGLNEIGKNFTVFECKDDMIIVDCGLAFPNDDMLGIDLVIPDFTFVEKNKDKIRGIIITHGHEDHIGSIPYLLKKFNVPIYGTSLAMGLIEVKLKEHNLASSAKLNKVEAGQTKKFGCFNVEFIHVNHSIMAAVALAIHSPAGTIVHTGDFKVDFTPPDGEMIDIARFAELGKSGVLALMADSTNVERPGYTQTEQKVKESLEVLFARADEKRIIVATFASNISRVQQIINCAIKHKRKVALSGRSMLNVMSIASELGYLNVPEGLIVDLSVINRYKKGEIVLITTGSQGETMAALSRMAFAEHRQVEVGTDDFIIISAKPIPGNEKTVGTLVDELLKRGCEVVYESMYEVHVSGHACQEELKMMHALTKPKYFIPVHGEQKHLIKHAKLAVSMGMPNENIFIGDIGKGLEINENFIKPTEDVPAGSVMVDGIGVGDVGSIVLRDRKHLGEDGLIIVVCAINSTDRYIMSGPDIVSRGFVYVRESEALMDNVRKLAHAAISDCVDEGVKEWNVIKSRVKDALSRHLYEKTRRRPMILPIILEV